MNNIRTKIIKSSLFSSIGLVILGGMLIFQSEFAIISISYIIGAILVAIGTLALIDFVKNLSHKELDLYLKFIFDYVQKYINLSKDFEDQLELYLMRIPDLDERNLNGDNIHTIDIGDDTEFKALLISLLTSLKEMLTIRQKLKMAKYRVNYHKHQLYKMENLIAESNEHTFLKGRNLNETR